MAQPLVTPEQIAAALKQQFVSQIPGTNIETFLVWTDTPDNVRYGVYVSNVAQVSKEPYQLAVRTGCAIYQVVDMFEITFISFKNDPNQTAVMKIISDLPGYTMTGASTQLFDGYHRRTYSQREEYGPRAARHLWEFSMERLEFL